MYWKETGLLHVKIRNYNIFYSSQKLINPEDTTQLQKQTRVATFPSYEVIFSRTLQTIFGGAVPFSSLYRLYTTSRKQVSSTVKQNIWFGSKLTLSKSCCVSNVVTHINNFVCLTFHDQQYFWVLCSVDRASRFIPFKEKPT